MTFDEWMRERFGSVDPWKYTACREAFLAGAEQMRERCAAEAGTWNICEYGAFACGENVTDLRALPLVEDDS